MITHLLTMLESDFLRFFIENPDINDWETTALGWVLAALVVSVLVAGLMLACKAVSKHLAGNIEQKAWSRGRTVLLILIGLGPVFLAIFVVWYFSRDYYNFIGVGGLIKGIVLSWFFYLFLMFLGHLLSSWRREIL